MLNLKIIIQKKVEIIRNKNKKAFFFAFCILLLVLNVSTLFAVVTSYNSNVRYRIIKPSVPEDPRQRWQSSMLDVSDFWWSDDRRNCESCSNSNDVVIDAQKAANIAHVRAFDGLTRLHHFQYLQPYLVHYDDEYDVFLVIAESRFYEWGGFTAVICARTGGLIMIFSRR